MKDSHRDERFGELQRLTLAHLRGEASDSEIEQLDRLVAGNPESGRLYLEIVAGETALRMWARSTTDLDELLIPDDSSLLDEGLPASTGSILSMHEEDAEVARQIVEGLVGTESLSTEKYLALQRERDRKLQPKRNAIPWNTTYAAVASVATVAAALILSIVWMLPDPAPVFVASIDDSIDARWSDESLSTASGTQLASGQDLVLTDGIVEIALGGGAKLIVEAPTTLELLSADSARLVLGKLVGQVPSREVRLTINTPQASIVDLGTEFGVEVDRQHVTHLRVFEGRVSVATTDAEGKAAQQRMVIVGEAVNLRPETGAIEPASASVAGHFRRKIRSETNYQNAVLASNPIAYWTFSKMPDELSPLRAVDVEGRPAWQVVYREKLSTGDGPKATAFRGFGSENVALNFGGVAGSRIDFDMGLANEGIERWTIEAWAKVRSLATNVDGLNGQTVLCVDEVDENNDVLLGLAPEGPEINQERRWAVNHQNARTKQRTIVQDKSDIVPGKWYHLVAACDGSELQLYVDGIEVDKRISANGFVMGGKSSRVLRIGGSLLGKGRTFDGQIDEVAVYDRALSAKEIRRHHQSAKNPVAMEGTSM